MKIYRFFDILFAKLLMLLPRLDEGRIVPYNSSK